MGREPIQKRAKTTKDSILIAAREILAKSGPIKTSISAVSHRAGVSVGSVYQYFKNLDSLYLNILQSENTKEMQMALDLVEKLAAEANEIDLEEVVGQMVDFCFLSLKRVYFLGQGVAAVLPMAHAKFRKTIRDEAQKGIAERLEKHADFFGKMNTEDAAFVLVHGACGVVEAYLVRREKLDETRVRNELKKMFVAYLAVYQT